MTKLMDRTGTWLRRVGIALFAAYLAFAFVMCALGRTVLRGKAFRSPGGLRAIFLADALLFTGMLAGAILLLVGLAIGIRSTRKSTSASASLKWEIAIACALILLAAISTLGSRRSPTAVALPIGKPGIVKTYNILYPGRRSAEPGDVEAQRNQSVRLEDFNVKVTKTKVIHPDGEYNLWPGWYLIVFYDATNNGSKIEEFNDMDEWEFDVPGKGVTFLDPTGGPMDTNVFGQKVRPGQTLHGRVSLFLGNTQAEFAHGDYYIIWTLGPCEVSRINDRPFGDCRGVWSAAKL